MFTVLKKYSWLNYLALDSSSAYPMETLGAVGRKHRSLGSWYSGRTKIGNFSNFRKSSLLVSSPRMNWLQPNWVRAFHRKHNKHVQGTVV